MTQLEDGDEYHLTSSAYSLGLHDEYAKFLESASYGARAEDLDHLESVTGNDLVNVHRYRLSSISNEYHDDKSYRVLVD